MSVEEHKKHQFKLKFGVITVSTTRTGKEDESGELIKSLLAEEHSFSFYKIIKDNIVEIRSALFDALDLCDFIVFNGGTGASRFDLTIEAVGPYFDKKIEGFGELFRLLSFQEIGSAALMSRAVAGIVREKIVFLIPGSPNAAKMAVKKLILPEVSHIHYEINKHKGKS